jgi:hypothetical protein
VLTVEDVFQLNLIPGTLEHMRRGIGVWIVMLVACSGDDGPSQPAATSGVELSTTGASSEGTSGAGSSSDEVGVTTDDQPCGFHCEDSHGDVAAPSCDLDDPDCHETEKCAPWSTVGGTTWDAAKCTPLHDSPAGLGEPCFAEGSGVSGVDSCDLGLWCLVLHWQTNEGVCAELCTPESACTRADTACVTRSEGLFGTCLVPCEPFDVGCDDDEVCYAFGLGQFGCAPPGAGESKVLGEACWWSTDCEPGLACVVEADVPGCEDPVNPWGGAASCCAAICDPAADAPCSDRGSCSAIAEEPMVGLCSIEPR